MREILFRAKRKNWCELPKKEWWVEGYPVKYPSGKIEIHEKCIDPPDILKITEIAPETICQFTGICDKNGKRIWENDIVHRAYHSEDDCIIVWNDGRFCFKTIHGQYNQDPMTLLSICFVQNTVERLTVIGNIFDNPELMEK